MASLQRSISRAITVKGLNKKQARLRRAEIKERKLRERGSKGRSREEIRPFGAGRKPENKVKGVKI